MFFYDEVLQLHISDTPLLISSRVLKAAESIGEKIKWNSHGHVCGVSHDVSMKLARTLGSRVLSVREFMRLAKRDPRAASPDFAEWLRDTYHLKSGIMYDEFGEVVPTKTARPGWFDLDEINDYGLPTCFSSRNATNKWKYWTLDDETFTSGAIRGFVTSSGTCSLDLGIPKFARHRNIMIREAYTHEPPSSWVPLDGIWQTYQRLVLERNRDDEALEQLLKQPMDEYAYTDDSGNSFLTAKRLEMQVDLRGKRRLLQNDLSNLRVIDYHDIVELLRNAKESAVTVVMGHPNPDADAIVSAVFEAVRRNIVYPDKPCIAWAESVPPEVEHILGPELSSIVQGALLKPHFETVLVDCQTSPFAPTALLKSVIDHHPIVQTLPYYVAQSQELCWSSTLQIYFKFLGSGLDLGPKAAKLLSEATILEAEPELMSSMSKTDKLAAHRLQSLAGPDTLSYEAAMSIMTNVEDISTRFRKDYKESSYGFAVIKARQRFDFANLARSNNLKRRLPLTIVKQVIYDYNFSKVLQEDIELYFNEAFHDGGFRTAVANVIASACMAFHGAAKVYSLPEKIHIRHGETQTPRLLLFPLVQQLVTEHLRFAYSCELQRYISCGFFSGHCNGRMYGQASSTPSVEAGLSWESVNDMLSTATNTSFLTLPEYWTVYHEFKDYRFAHSSLTDSTYVELLNSQVLSGGDSTCSTIIHRDVKEDIIVLEAKPAQVRPEDFGPHGLPVRIATANSYDSESLWRYWSPDAAHNVATRGHIFIMDRPCIDLKISPLETTQRLTFRPIYRTIPDIKYKVSHDQKSWIKLEVFPRLFTIY